MRTRIVVAVAVVSATAVVLLGGGAPASGDRAPKAQGTPGLENRALFAVLTGRNEVDENGRRGAGDRDGRGTFSATFDGGELCFGITVKNIDAPGAAHIHRGRSNVNGPIVVPLTQPDDGDPGASSGCVEVESSLARAILKNPRRFYANVHTAAFGAGAVRGQLFRNPR